MTEQLHLNDEELRKADEAEVAGWKNENGEPLTPEEQKLAADNFAQLRQEVKENIERQNNDHEGEQND